MEGKMQSIKIILTLLISFVTSLLGGYDMAIQVLTTLIVIDYITGIMKAIITKQLSSYLGFKGIMKKVSYYLCIIVAVQLELLINQPNTIHSLIAYGFVANEGISILENLDALGIKVDILKKHFDNMRNENNKKNKKEDDSDE
jgi:toxin secretion/phage lysis holin